VAPAFPLVDGVWAEILRAPEAPAAKPRPGLFLDRDGVVIEDPGYLHEPAEVRLIPGAAAAIQRANQRGIPVVLVSNQSGIGRGLYGWPAFAATQARLLALLAAEGAGLDMVLACPYHPEGQAPYRHPDHPCRKPRPGMLLLAAERLALDLAGSWLVGDRALDIEAAGAAGLAGAVQVLTGQGAGERKDCESLTFSDLNLRFAANLEAAVGLIPIFG
jgi:D-glycero-D-manno-heptose 1,7-bisphosphate phosphatase